MTGQHARALAHAADDGRADENRLQLRPSRQFGTSSIFTAEMWLSICRP